MLKVFSRYAGKTNKVSRRHKWKALRRGSNLFSSKGSNIYACFSSKRGKCHF